MPQPSEKARKQSYKAVLSTPAGRDMLDDLILYAMMEKDIALRCGKADVILKILREERRTEESL